MNKYAFLKAKLLYAKSIITGLKKPVKRVLTIGLQDLKRGKFKSGEIIS